MTTIQEHPIACAETMVQAMLAGRMTMTRRIIRPHREWSVHDEEPRPDADFFSTPCPYGKPGDRLYVCEAHRPIWGQSPGYLIGVDYRADPRDRWERLGDMIGMPTEWISAGFMRRRFSRILLEVTDVRIERLQDITEADALAEGIRAMPDGDGTFIGREGVEGAHYPWPTAQAAYADAWDGTYGHGTWRRNPFVWVVSFKQVGGEHG